MWIRNAMLLAAAALFLAAASLLPRGLLDEGPPSAAPVDLIALALSLAASLPLGWLVWRDGRDDPDPMPGQAIFVGFVIAAALALAGTMVVSPAAFTAFLVEDGPGEWLSAGLLFAGGGAAAVALLRHRQLHWLERFFMIGVLAGMLIVGFEEVSWFQRVIGVETPQWLADVNLQGEINFHNASTSIFENIYYAGSAILLVGTRALLALPGHSAFGRSVRSFAPAVPAFATACLSCAFNWDMWGIVFIAAAFGLAVAVAAVETTVAARAERRGLAMLLAITLVATLAIQALFLVFGATMTRAWDATEARELLIAAALVLYCLQLAASPVRQR